MSRQIFVAMSESATAFCLYVALQQERRRWNRWTHTPFFAKVDLSFTPRWYVAVTNPKEARLMEAWIDLETGEGGACLVHDRVVFFADRREANAFVKVYGGEVQAM